MTIALDKLLILFGSNRVLYRDYFMVDERVRFLFTRSKTRSFVCDSPQRMNKNRISELTMT